jgi:hypothetical protein
MAVAKCTIDHIKRSRFLRSADQAPVGVPAKERNVGEKTPWGGPSGFCVHGHVSNNDEKRSTYPFVRRE